MLAQLIRNTTFELMAEALRHPDSAARAQLAEAFRELHYRSDLPQAPGTDPSQVDGLSLREAALFGLADAALNHVELQPDRNSIADVSSSKSLRLAEARRLYNSLRNEIARLRDDLLFPIANRILPVTFSVSGVNDAATSQGTNLNREKVNIALRQALSLWSAVVPLEFRPPIFVGEEARVRINFVRDQQGSQVLGTTAGFISSTPAGLIGSASITIDCDNKLFVDRFLEPDRLPVLIGPFDLVGLLAHEVGHALGLDHGPGLMSASIGEDGVRRQLFPFDIREVQRRHGAIRLAETVKGLLATTAQLIDASPGIQLQRGSFGLIVFGPMETRTLLDVLVPAKGRLINALRLKFTTVTANVFVNRVTVFDGIIPIEEFAVSARSFRFGEGLAGRPHDLRLGFLSRRTTRNNMLVRMEIFFTRQEGQPEAEFGVLQVEEIAVETLPQPIINNPGVVFDVF